MHRCSSYYYLFFNYLSYYLSVYLFIPRMALGVYLFIPRIGPWSVPVYSRKTPQNHRELWKTPRGKIAVAKGFKD